MHIIIIIIKNRKVTWNKIVMQIQTYIEYKH